jgi:hypothetical protein
MVAPVGEELPAFERILKSHTLVHSAEGELYRRVFGKAAGALGNRPVRVPADQLAARVAAGLGLSPEKLDARLAALGKAWGRPWAADQKQLRWSRGWRCCPALCAGTRARSDRDPRARALDWCGASSRLALALALVRGLAVVLVCDRLAGG